MAGIQGNIGRVVDNAVILPDNQRLKVQFDQEISYLNVDKNLLMQFSSKLKKNAVERMKFSWNTQERKKDFVTLNGAVTGFAGTSSGTFTVSATDAFLFAEGDVILFPDVDNSQTIYVSAVNQSTGVVTAETVAGGTITIADTNVAFLMGNSFESGSGVGTIKSEQPTEVFNYLQIMQTPVGVTTTANHLGYESNPEFQKQVFEAGIDHAFNIEKTLFVGKKHRATTGFMSANGKYEQWFTGGLFEAIQTNAVAASGGVLTQTEFSDWLIQSTKYAKNSVIFASERVYEALTFWAETKLELTRNESTLGMAVTKYQTAYGDTVMLMPHRELLINELNDMAFCVDMAELEYKFLKGLDTHIERDVQQPGDKLKTDEYRTWFGMKWGNEKRHGVLTGVDTIS